MITEARVDELFDFVDRELHKIKRSRKLPGGVVLTGGTAKLPGLADFAKDKLQLAARVGKLQPISGLVDTVEDSAYATVVGLMLLDMLLLPDQQVPGNSRPDAMGLVQGFWRRFRG